MRAIIRKKKVAIFGIVRNPLAVLAPWREAPKEFRPDWDFAKEWRGAPSKNQGRPEEFFGYDRWREAAAAFLGLLERFPDQFRLVRYSSLRANPLAETERLFSFYELDMDPRTRTFLAESTTRHEENPYSVFRAGVNPERWRSVLPSFIIKEIRADLAGTDLEIFLSGDDKAEA